MQSAAAGILGRALCPWLEEPYARLEAARTSGRLGHAWLLGGPAGIGKLNLALVMAQRLLEPDSSPPPATLSAADARTALALIRASHDHHPDLHTIFPLEDRQTISIDQIRELGTTLGLKSLRGSTKVVIVEPAEAMTVAAANSFLKTLEEPTPSTYLWLVSHQPGRLPATIRSRCQQLLLRAPDTPQAREWLGERWSAPASLFAPLRIAALEEDELSFVNKELQEALISLSRSEADPQRLADQWLKANLPLALDWLAAELRLAIRGRLAPEAGTLVTDRGPNPLHNAWRSLPIERLWAQLAATEQMSLQLGKGLNEDLALRVLLLGFIPPNQ